MRKELILQGLTNRTHAKVIEEMYVGTVERAIISVAFVSEDGVNHIAHLLKTHASKITVYAGIRNDITSSQALKLLLKIGVSLYVVDTGSSMLLFHPKIYHVRTSDSASISVGSANLTLSGLNNNIEAGILLDLSLNNADDLAFVNNFEASFDELDAKHPENVLLVNDDAMVAQLLNAGRLIDEAVAFRPRTATKAAAGSTDPTPRMRMLTKVVRGKTKQRTPISAPAQVPPAALGLIGAASPGNVVGTATTVAPDLDLVWESKPLSRRSLGIPAGKKSNHTGSTTLGTGTFRGIDRVSYFRNGLFGHNGWTLNGSIETAAQKFDLVIKGILVGTFDLTLRHSLTRAAAAADDHNSPTSLSWNEARTLVAREDLLGRTMRLWRSPVDSTKFQVEID